MFSRLRKLMTAKAEHGKQKEFSERGILIFEELFDECFLYLAEDGLSHSMRNILQSLSIYERKAIVSRAKMGCTPLLAACEKGNIKIVQYLIEHCDADVEQRGTLHGNYREWYDHVMTPLWCASVFDNLSLVQCLVEHGANVNCVSHTGYTLVQTLCDMSLYNIVKYLIENNADILKASDDGYTCLMYSTQCLPLCELLIQHGADVNAQNINLSTALHFAISESDFNVNVMELLLKNGADPFLKNMDGNDALQTACLNMEIHALEYLFKKYSYSRQRIAEAYELIGSTYLEKKGNQHMCLHYWHLALSIRYTENPNEMVPKTIARKVPYSCIPEFNSVEELEKISLDEDAMYTQSLLVRERILGHLHRNTIFHLQYRAYTCFYSYKYKDSFNLETYALNLSIQLDTLLDAVVYADAENLIRIFMDIYEANKNGMTHKQIEFRHVFELMNILTCQLESCISLLAVKPVFKTQQDIYDNVLTVFTHLIYVFCVIPKTPEQVITMKKVIIKVLHMEPRTSEGDTLLHLVVSKLNFTYPSIFPDAEVLEILLECGASVGTVNHNLNTPLHIAALPFNFTPEVIDLLLIYGAHIDQRNDAGNSPYSMLQNHFEYNIDYLQFTTLKCLAARKIMEKKVPFIGKVPLLVEEFIRIH